MGVFLERSLELIVSLLGALKAGGAYLPIDPSLPRQRIDFMLKDARPGVILTVRGLAARLPAAAGSLLLLDDEHLPSEDLREPRPAAPGPSDLAYVGGGPERAALSDR